MRNILEARTTYTIQLPTISAAFDPDVACSPSAELSPMQQEQRICQVAFLTLSCFMKMPVDHLASAK